jgi:hypothetical protein
MIVDQEENEKCNSDEASSPKKDSDCKAEK